jgi:hypothetical protein
VEGRVPELHVLARPSMIARGIDLEDFYSISLPTVKSSKATDEGLLAVTPASSAQRIDLVERFGTYIKRELKYDFPPDIDDGDGAKVKGYFFLGDGWYPPNLQPVGVVVFKYVNANRVRPEHVEQIGNRWWLEWIWLHPYERRKGLLSRHWPAFVEEFGNFYVAPPLSHSMKQFLEKKGIATT